MGDLARSLEDELDGVVVYTFDYGSDSDRWPSSPTIAACLATFVRNVSEKNDVPVVYAAHSMGGLAIRFASDREYAGSAALTSDELREVVTIDSPHLGSPWGGTLAAELLQVGQMLDAHGGLPGQGREAARCLAVTRPCEPSPFLPAGTSLTSVSGATAIKRTLFGVELYTIPMGGDGVVLDGSMSGYLTSGPPGSTRPAGRVGFTTASCTEDSGAMTGLLSRLTPPVPAGIVGAWARAFADMSAWDDIDEGKLSVGSGTLWAVATLTAPCSHTKIMDQPEARAAIIGAVNRAKKAAPIPLMNEAQLRNTTIPAGSCYTGEMGWPGDQPIALRDGQGSVGDPDAGNVNSIMETRLLGRADVNADGVHEVVLMLHCSGSLPELCCAGQTSLMWMVGVFREDKGRLARVATPYSGGLTYPGDEYGPLSRGIQEASLEGTSLVTREYIHYSTNYSPEQAGGDPLREFEVELDLVGNQWIEP